MNTLANDRGTAANQLACIYEAVDAVLAHDGSVPPGATGLLHRSIDAMRAESAGDPFVARAEAIALAIHRLQIALLDRSDDTLHRRLRKELEILGREWIEATPLFH